ncbi:MAG: AsmA-like C-terminal domain-containing protein [Thermodesulfobacterium sp.]|jgi:hypothetical protein|nr:AsmA-like C-terminal domain-containing protein [Thermodesulfobacterium sp.]
MKRFLLYFGLLFLFFLFLLGFCTLNLTFFLNHPFFKEKLKNYLERNHQIKVEYHHVSVDLVKLHFKFQDFKLEHPRLFLALPKAKVDFDWSKLVRGSYFPEEVHLSSPTIKLSIPETPEEEEIKFDYKALLQKLAPIRFVVRDGNFSAEYKGKNFELKGLNLNLVDRKDQLLFDLKVSANIFSQLSLKGYLNYVSFFGEGSVEVKQLNLKPALKLVDFDPGENKLNLQAQISVEKDRVYAGFSGDAPCLIRLDDGQRVICGYFEGVAILGKDGWEVEFPLLDFHNPRLKGELKVLTTPNGVDVSAKADSLDFESISPVLAKLLPKEVFKAISDYLKGGLFTDLTFQARGKDWDEAFSLNTIGLSGEVKDGKVEIPGLPLSFAGVEGKVSLEKAKLRFEGSGIVNENIQLKGSEVLVDLGAKEPRLEVKSQFSGLAENLKDLALRLSKDASSLENYQVSGKVEGSIALSGYPASLDVALSLFPKDVYVSIAPLKKPVRVSSGSIDYKNERLSFSGINLFFEDGEALDLKGLFEIKNKLLSLSISQVSLPKETLFTLLSLDEGIKQKLEPYAIDLDEVFLKDVALSSLSLGSLDKEQALRLLSQSLSFSGRIKGLSLRFDLTNQTISLSSPELFISFKNGLLYLDESLVKVEDSEFSLFGSYALANSLLTLRGKGEVKETLYGKISSLVSLPQGVRLKLPAKVELQELNLDKEKIAGDLSILGEGAKLSLQAQYGLASKGLDLTSRFEGNSSDLSLSLSYEQSLKVSLKGELSALDTLVLFEGLPLSYGKISSDLSVNLEEKDLKALEDFKKDPLQAFHRLLSSGNLFPRPSSLHIKDLTLKEPLSLTATLSADFKNSTVSISSFRVKSEGLDFNGSLAVKAKEDALWIDGKLFSETLDLAKIFPTEVLNATKERPKTAEIELTVPVNVNIAFSLHKVILPTNHTIESLNGTLSIVNGTTYALKLPEVNLCGLSFTAEAEKTNTFHYGYIELNPSQGDLLDLFSCLYPNEMPKVIFEGPFKAHGFFYFDGEKSLIEHSYGEVYATSHKGYMYRAPLLMRVLGFLSPIDLFRGKIPDLEKNLLPLDELTLALKASNSYLLVDEFFMSAQGFRLFSSGYANLKDKGLSLTFLVSPFKTVDVAIEHIPYLSKLLLGKERMLVYLPLEVVGTYDNPIIVPLHPASIGKGIFRFVFKFFGINEDFFQRKPELEGIKRKDVFERKLENPQRR